MARTLAGYPNRTANSLFNTHQRHHILLHCSFLYKQNLSPESFFSGLLPDEPIRSNIAPILKVSTRNTFEMLKHLGGDCAGAIQILPIESPQNAESNQKTQPLSNDELFSILQNLPQRPLGMGIEGFHISGAGAHCKRKQSVVSSPVWLSLYPHHQTQYTRLS